MEDLKEDLLEMVRNVTSSIEKNIHLHLSEINEGGPDEGYRIEFNAHVIFSPSRAFLEAIQSEIGGEIIHDPDLGPFLYYRDDEFQKVEKTS